MSQFDLDKDVSTIIWKFSQIFLLLNFTEISNKFHLLSKRFLRAPQNESSRELELTRKRALKRESSCERELKKEKSHKKESSKRRERALKRYVIDLNFTK